MGRLFRKFFIFIWLVQMAGMVTVGTTFWLRHKREVQAEQLERASPEARAPHPDRLPVRHRHPPRFPTIPLIATLVASLVCAALLARYFSHPIRRLRGAFEAAAQGKLDTRIGDTMGGRRDELADLGRDFDVMADRISALIGVQRQLLHDVSHELRSPLARLQAAIGLARQQPEKLAASLERIETESQRIDGLVGELLTLSRLEAGVMDAPEEVFALDDLLEDIVEDARFEAAARGQTVTLQSRCDAMVRGRPELLHRAVENVVRNALKHTPPDGCITVDCAREADSLHIAVRDQGPGIAEAELPHIFEPFFRGSGSTSGNGHGLGLAIARKVVEAHGGSMHATNQSHGGLRVEIRLPVTQA